MNPQTFNCKLTYNLLDKGKEYQSELLDIQPIISTSNKVVVLLHGMQFGRKTEGGWEMLRLMAGQVVDQGYRVLAPSILGFGKTVGERDYCGPESVSRLLCSLHEWLDINDHVDEFIIIGVSRGATLGILAAMQEPKMFSHIISVSGFYDLDRLYNHCVDEKKKENIEQECGVSKDKLNIRSPLKNASYLQTPLLILHGEDDNQIDVQQAYDFAYALEKSNKNYTLDVLKERGHSLLSDGLFTEKVLPFINANENT